MQERYPVPLGVPLPVHCIEHSFIGFPSREKRIHLPSKGEAAQTSGPFTNDARKPAPLRPQFTRPIRPQNPTVPQSPPPVRTFFMDAPLPSPCRKTDRRNTYEHRAGSGISL